MTTKWYYAKDDNRVGPVEDAEFRQLAESGGLEPFDRVWKKGMKHWTPAAAVPGVLAAEPAFQASIQEWYYAEGTEKRGPVSFERLEQLVAERHLGPSDWVWNESLDEWKPVCEVAELSAHLDSARSEAATHSLPTQKPPVSRPTKAALAATNIRTLAAKVATLSEVREGQLVTPKRIAICGLTVSLLATAWLAFLSFQPNSASQLQPNNVSSSQPNGIGNKPVEFVAEAVSTPRSWDAVAEFVYDAKYGGGCVLDVSKEGHRILVGGKGFPLQVVTPSSGHSSVFSKNWEFAALSPDGQRAVVVVRAVNPQHIDLRDAASGKLASEIPLPSGIKCGGVLFSGNGQFIAIHDRQRLLHADDTVHIMNSTGSETVAKVSGEFPLSFSPDRNLVALKAGHVSSTRSRVKIYDFDSQRVVTTIDAPTRREQLPISNIRFSPNGKLLAVQYREDDVVIFDVTTWQLHARWNKDSFKKTIPMELSAFDFSPDSTRIALAGGPGGFLAEWDFNNDEVTWLVAHTARVAHVAYCREGVLVSLGLDRRLRVWQGRSDDDGSFTPISWNDELRGSMWDDPAWLSRFIPPGSVEDRLSIKAGRCRVFYHTEDVRDAVEPFAKCVRTSGLDGLTTTISVRHPGILISGGDVKVFVASDESYRNDVERRKQLAQQVNESFKDAFDHKRFFLRVFVCDEGLTETFGESTFRGK